MNTARTKSEQVDPRWLCMQVKKLIGIFGAEGTGSILGRSARVVRKMYNVAEEQNLTLRNMVALERESVEIGMRPVFSIAHLEAMGFDVELSKRDPEKPLFGPATCATAMIPTMCDSMKEIVRSAEDMEISPAENERIEKNLQQFEEMVAAYRASYRAAQDM
ncbi:hypothetical protein [Polycladidibacter hongkongensis]|uniref:hypothetical protein n=1 Tax=Polycladidibacter hongkongensis TaxID=1647556 RepID=UPI000830DA6F|nr:hypothetical protein [Pseudovibrio hongkongensis]